jgi:hypothetical protein
VREYDILISMLAMMPELVALAARDLSGGGSRGWKRATQEEPATPRKHHLPRDDEEVST